MCSVYKYYYMYMVCMASTNYSLFAKNTEVKIQCAENITANKKWKK